MSVYVYPTDRSWFEFLRERSPLDEVNFWQPGGRRAFTGLQAGELFLFRLHSPVNMIAGGGVFEHATVFPLDGAWEAFGEKNGVPDFQALFTAIARYRRSDVPLAEDAQIGCIILRSPFFLPERDWIQVPDDYHTNLVQGKRFPTESATGRSLAAWAEDHLRRMVPLRVATRPVVVPGQMYGEPVLAKRRLGQGTFRTLVSDAYDRRCAVTGEKTLPVLEAAHIKPVSKGGEHRIDNGLLLRSDLHRLFDLGYVTVTASGAFHVSKKLKESWLNGRVYYDLDGSQVRLPSTETLRPSQLLLEWHGDTVFRK